MLRNLNQSSGGQRVCGTPKSGVLGSLIPATGDNGAGYTYNDLSLPADNAKEICGRITTWPSSGTLFAYEDTSFEFSGAPDGGYSFQYQLYVDGVAVGSPTSVTLTVGSIAATAQFTATTDSAVFSGGAVVSGVPNEVSFSVTTDDAVFVGGAYVLLPATASFNATTDSAVASFSAAVAAIAGFSVTTADAVFFGAARSANADEFIRAPSGIGPTVIQPGSIRPRQSATSRPSNTGGRRY